MLLPLMRLMTAQLALSGDLQRIVSAVHRLPEGFSDRVIAAERGHADGGLEGGVRRGMVWAEGGPR